MVHASRGALEPASPHLRSEVDIVCGIARPRSATVPSTGALSPTTTTPIRDHIAAAIPGFDDFNAARAAPGWLRPAQPAA